MIDQELLISNLKTEFGQIFQNQNSSNVYFAPGRVNLIGEHTDYNGGAVFPCAITLGTYAVIAKNQKGYMRLFSSNFPEVGIREVALTNIEFSKQDQWANYVKSVMWVLLLEGVRFEEGYDIYFHGTLPNQSGLSSSASIEVLSCRMLLSEQELTFSNERIARLAQRAENDFMHVQCGIMDQFAISMGKKDHAIYLNTQTMDYKYAPIILGDYQLMIVQSNKKRTLGDSAYNQRRMECEKARLILSKKKDIQSLCELSVEEFYDLQNLILDPVIKRRALHVITENQRTIDAFEALQNGRLIDFGRLMNESHESLRDNYEVTGNELDTLVETAWKQEGVIGARMTGAGFGGCTIHLVEKDSLDSFMNEVGHVYEEKCHLKADFYKVSIGGGPEQILF